MSQNLLQRFPSCTNRNEKVGSNLISAWQIRKPGIISEENTPPTSSHHAGKEILIFFQGRSVSFKKRGKSSTILNWPVSVHCRLFISFHLTSHTHSHTLLTLLFIISLHAGRAICHPVTHLHTHVNTCVSICGNFLYRRFCKSFGVIENIFFSVMPNSNINKYPK